MGNLEHKLAVVTAGGKQHLVYAGKKITVNQVSEKEGATISLKDELSEQPIQLRVLRHFLGEKVRGLKFKNKVRYLKRYGHRQKLSQLEVVSIGPTDKTESKKPAAKTRAKTVKKAKND
jgi:large subunit ribosomal protein L21